MYQRYKDKGLIIWNILTEGPVPVSKKISPENCAAHYSKYNFSFPALRDEGGKVLQALFFITAVPMNALITIPDMKVVFKFEGSIPDKLEAEIQANL